MPESPEDREILLRAEAEEARNDQWHDLHDCRVCGRYPCECEDDLCLECGQPLACCNCEDPPTDDIPFVDVFGII